MQYERLKTLNVEVVLHLLGDEKKAGQSSRMDFGGVMAHVTGLRLATFKKKGLTCVKCGVKGAYFALERSAVRTLSGEISAVRGSLPYHLNLYALGAGGEEILMTHDHTIPKVAGGVNNLSNTQTMCSPCNSEKSQGEDPSRPGLYLWLDK